MSRAAAGNHLSAALAAVLAVGTLMAGTSRAQSEGFVPLFDGTLRGWVIEHTTAGNFTVRDGTLRVEGPSGWLRSERQYADFLLRAEFRFLTADADSGLFVRAVGDAIFMRGWPGNSYQVQLRVPTTPSFLPPVGGILRHGTAPGETVLDTALVEKVFTGVGEWQTIDVDVRGDRLVVRYNGTEVTRAGHILNSPGHIGIQGETGALEFRSIEISEQD